MMGLFGSSSKAPPVVPTDTVVPMHCFDDHTVFRGILLYLTLCFDEVLDPERLRTSLERLMELGDWRKLGARLRKTKDGKLEYHIPESFSAKRPGFGYTHVRYHTSIKDHPLASRIPRASDQPAIYSDLGDLKNLAHSGNAPKSIEDFCTSDHPQLSLHIVSFEDATLVSLSWLHTFLDAIAMSDLLKAWTSVLIGKEEEVPRICNFREDPLSSLGVAPKETHKLAKRALGGLSAFYFVILMIIDLVFYRDSGCFIYMPAKNLSAMKEAATRDLTIMQAAEKDSGEESTVPFLSTGDILCAFLTWLSVKNEGRTSGRQVCIMNTFSLRSVLASSLLPPSAGRCLSNVVFAVTAFGPARDVITKPLAYTAALIRKSIIEQGTPAQVDAYAAMVRKSVEQSGWPPLFGEGGMRLVTFTNWKKGEMFQMNFGGARMEGGSSRTAQPFFVNVAGETKISFRNSWPIIGMDNSGGYWMQGYLRNDLWPSVKDELKEMAASENGAKGLANAE